MAYTYYIRSWDPRSTYPTNPQEGDICYTITKDQTWAPVGGVKKDNIVKEEIYQNGAWVEQGGGGGGESDYSTCTVTLAGNLYVDKPMFAIPILIERKNGICLESAVNVYQESSEDYTVLLYKGQAVAMNQQTTSSVSGAVTKAYSAGDKWYTYTITGDCTITIGSDK